MTIAGNNLPAAAAGEAMPSEIRGAEGVLGETGSEMQRTDINRGSATKRDIQLRIQGSRLKSQAVQKPNLQRG